MAKRWNFRLNLWIRLAIVLTAFWMVGATFTIALKGSAKANEAASATLDQCQDAQRLSGDFLAAAMWKGKDCWKERERVRGYYTPWTEGLVFAGIFAVLAWIFGGIFYGSTRWVLAGRRRADA